MFLQKKFAIGLLSNQIEPLLIIMKGNPLVLEVTADVIPVPCLDVIVFVSWLINYMDAQIIGEWHAQQMLVKIPGMSVCKVFNAEMYSLPTNFNLSVGVKSLRGIIMFMKELGIKGRGKKHWRIFSIPNEKGKIIAHVHAARHDKPLY